MRKELYRMLCRELKAIDLIKHIDFSNHNVEFIEQEENWERPAVFVEFCPIQWNAIVPGVEYRAEPLIKLHIVTDWEGSSAEGSELQEDALKVFDLSGLLHAQLAGLSGETFWSWIWWRVIPITTMRILWKVSRYISVWPSSGCNSRLY